MSQSNNIKQDIKRTRNGNGHGGNVNDITRDRFISLAISSIEEKMESEKIQQKQKQGSSSMSNGNSQTLRSDGIRNRNGKVIATTAATPSSVIATSMKGLDVDEFENIQSGKKAKRQLINDFPLFTSTEGLNSYIKCIRLCMTRTQSSSASSSISSKIPNLSFPSSKMDEAESDDQHDDSSSHSSSSSNRFYKQGGNDSGFHRKDKIEINDLGNVNSNNNHLVRLENAKSVERISSQKENGMEWSLVASPKLIQGIDYLIGKKNANENEGEIVAIDETLSELSALLFIRGFEFILDCTDRELVSKWIGSFLPLLEKKEINEKSNNNQDMNNETWSSSNTVKLNGAKANEESDQVEEDPDDFVYEDGRADIHLQSNQNNDKNGGNSQGNGIFHEDKGSKYDNDGDFDDDSCDYFSDAEEDQIREENGRILKRRKRKTLSWVELQRCLSRLCHLSINYDYFSSLSHSKWESLHLTAIIHRIVRKLISDRNDANFSHLPLMNVHDNDTNAWNELRDCWIKFVFIFRDRLLHRPENLELQSNAIKEIFKCVSLASRNPSSPIYSGEDDSSGPLHAISLNIYSALVRSPSILALPQSSVHLYRSLLDIMPDISNKLESIFTKLSSKGKNYHREVLLYEMTCCFDMISFLLIMAVRKKIQAGVGQAASASSLIVRNGILRNAVKRWIELISLNNKIEVTVDTVIARSITEEEEKCIESFLILCSCLSPDAVITSYLIKIPQVVERVKFSESNESLTANEIIWPFILLIGADASINKDLQLELETTGVNRFVYIVDTFLKSVNDENIEDIHSQSRSASDLEMEREIRNKPIQAKSAIIIEFAEALSSPSLFLGNQLKQTKPNVWKRVETQLKRIQTELRKLASSSSTTATHSTTTIIESNGENVEDEGSHKKNSPHQHRSNHTLLLRIIKAALSSEGYGAKQD